jgi:Cysteine-rich secretory protein family
MKAVFATFLSLLLITSSLAAETPPAEMISDFRLREGEGRVVVDPTLNRIALEQAKAMADKDTLDHEVLSPFIARIAPARSGPAAENIAYGSDSFEKTLAQWISSPAHRKNLLLQKASRVGVASAKSANSLRTYWAMVIVGEYGPAPMPTAPRVASETKRSGPAQLCRSKILGICFDQ